MTVVVMIRQTDIHRTFHLKSESGCLKFGVTPAGGGVAGWRPELVAMRLIRKVITTCKHQSTLAQIEKWREQRHRAAIYARSPKPEPNHQNILTRNSTGRIVLSAGMHNTSLPLFAPRKSVNRSRIIHLHVAKELMIVLVGTLVGNLSDAMRDHRSIQVFASLA